MRYAINGYLFAQRQTGAMRFTREILSEMDKICKKGEITLVCPEYANSVPSLSNINVVYYGKTKGNLWEQIDFSKYLRINKIESVNFNNTMPLFRRGIMFIHDIAYKTHPEFFSSFHGKISIIYHRIIFRAAALSKKPILTITYYSKSQLMEVYHVKPSRIQVFGCAWQHINTVSYDDSIFEKIGVSPKNYYFSLGSLSKMKNTKWFIDVAKKYPDRIFVLSGAKPSSEGELYDLPKNVILTGYISDEEIKSLLRECKAFIYPSIYDGFGIPPIEALSQGSQVICSNAACLPEVYGNCVHYIDPYNTNVDLDELLAQKVSDPDLVLKKYSWKKSAFELYNFLKQYQSKRKNKT